MVESILESVVPEKNNKKSISSSSSLRFSVLKSYIAKVTYFSVVEPSKALVAQKAAAAVAVLVAEALAAVAILQAHLVVRLEVDDLVPDERMGW